MSSLESEDVAAVRYIQRELETQLLRGEDTRAADNYYFLGIMKHKAGDFVSALKHSERSLDIRRNLLGEEHPDTANSYFSIGATQLTLENLPSGDKTKAVWRGTPKHSRQSLRGRGN